MTNTTTCKQYWGIIGVAVSTILFGMALPMTASDTTGKLQPVRHSQLTKKQAEALVATAKTPADHLKLAAYFNKEADKLEAEAKDHDDLAQVYRLNPFTAAIGGKFSGGGSPFRTADHCDAMAKSLRDAARSSRDLAAEHERMAEEATK